MKTPFLHIKGGVDMKNTAGVKVYYCSNLAQGSKIPAELSKLGLMDDVFLKPVPCSGKIDPRYMLKAMESGARGVCILACPKGHCRMFEGNLRANARVHCARQLIAEAGLDPYSIEIIQPEGPGENMLLEAIEKVASFVNGERVPAIEVAV